MKPFYLLLTVTTTLASLPVMGKCHLVKGSFDYKLDKPPLNPNDSIKLEGPLFDNGLITCRYSRNYQRGDQKVVSRVEKGSFKGLKYRVHYSDGSGTIQGLSSNNLDTRDPTDSNWSLRCKKDLMSDTHWCGIQRASLTIGINKYGYDFISIGYDHYPNSAIAIKVDNNEIVSSLKGSSFNSTQTEEILEQLKNGSLATTRYQQWPNKQNVDVRIELWEFADAMTILKKVYESIK